MTFPRKPQTLQKLQTCRGEVLTQLMVKHENLVKLHYYFESRVWDESGLQTSLEKFKKGLLVADNIFRYIYIWLYMQLYNYTNHILVYIYIAIYIYTHILDVTFHRYIKWHLNGNIHLYIIYTHQSINEFPPCLGSENHANIESSPRHFRGFDRNTMGYSDHQ